MNKFLKFLLIYFITSITIVKCDETVELTCSLKKDCESFEDKKVEGNCIEGKCVCHIRRSEKQELVPCLPRATSSPRLSEPKSVTEDVTLLKCPCDLPNYECVDGKFCDCKKGFSKIDGKCMQVSVLLGKSCESDDQCKAFDNLSECHDGEKICKCAKEFTELESTCRSMVMRMGRSTCKEKSECQDKEECITGRCVCNKNHIALERNNTVECHPVGHFGEQCVENKQCEMGLGVGSVCTEKKCACNESHKKAEIGGKIVCKRNIRVGDPCNNHNECVPYAEAVSMTCHNNKCVCAADYELFDAYSRRCAPKSNSRSSSEGVKSIHVCSILAFIGVIAVLLK